MVPGEGWPTCASLPLGLGAGREGHREVTARRSMKSRRQTFWNSVLGESLGGLRRRVGVCVHSGRAMRRAMGGGSRGCGSLGSLCVSEGNRPGLFLPGLQSLCGGRACLRDRELPGWNSAFTSGFCVLAGSGWAGSLLTPSQPVDSSKRGCRHCSKEDPGSELGAPRRPPASACGRSGRFGGDRGAARLLPTLTLWSHSR